MQIRTTSEGEEFAYAQIWSVVTRHLERAQSGEGGSLFHDGLVVMVFATHALEGYVNCLGERIAPDIWKQERNHFRSSGLAGKISKIREICGISEPDAKIRPYSTLRELKELRDLIAHPKTRRFANEIVHLPEVDIPSFSGVQLLSNLVTAEKVVAAAEDIEAVVNEIHAQARHRLRDDDWFRGDSPLRGPIAISFGGSEVIKSAG